MVGLAKRGLKNNSAGDKGPRHHQI